MHNSEKTSDLFNYKTKLSSQLVAKGEEQRINHLEKSIGRWTITTKANGGAEQRNEDAHSDMNERLHFCWLVCIFFLRKKASKQTNKKKKRYTYLREEGL